MKGKPPVRDRQSQLRATLVLAAAALAVSFSAFEAREPLFKLAFTRVTTSEAAALVFVIALAVWAAGDLKDFLSRRALDLPVLFFVASNLVAVAVSEDRATSLRYTLRMALVGLVYLGISRLPVRRRSHLVVAGAVSVTVMVVAFVGLAESYDPGLAWTRVLKVFQESVTTFGNGSIVRISSTLPFSTLLSAYLELCLPLFIVFGLWLAGRVSGMAWRRLLIAGTLAGMAVIITAQLQTFTRTGYVVLLLSMLLGAALGSKYGYGRRVWGMFAAGLVLMVVIFGMAAGFDYRLGARLGGGEVQPGRGVEYTLLEAPAGLKTGEQGTARIRLRNTGSDIWEPGGGRGTNLTYRWVSYPGGGEQTVEYMVTDLPHAIAPGAEVDVRAEFNTPGESGRYVLVFDMVAVGATWFSAVSSPPLAIPVEFGPDGGGRVFEIEEKAAVFNAGGAGTETPPRSQLWQAAVRAWASHPLLGLGPDQFRLRHHEYYEGLIPDERFRTHNIFLEALATTGVVGLAAMVYLLAAALWVQYRLVRDRGMEMSARLLSLGVTIATVGYISHNLLDCFLWQTGVAYMFFTVLGLTAWLDRYRFSEPGPSA